MLINSIMLVALGFLSASLIALILSPFLWSRAVRLTTERIKSTMPITQAEMQADKDQLRADFAIKIRQFEIELEHTNIKAARQLIELSRRETDISKLKVEMSGLSTELEEQHNANNVMRQTITTRIPQLEAKLQKAKEMLGARFQEISRLRTTISQQEGQLGEVRSVEQQRLAEIQRLKSTLESQEHAKLAQQEYEKVKSRNDALIAEVHQLKNQLLKAQKNAETEAKTLKQQMHVLSDRLIEFSKQRPSSPPKDMGSSKPNTNTSIQQEQGKAPHPAHLKPVEVTRPAQSAPQNTEQKITVQADNKSQAIQGDKAKNMSSSETSSHALAAHSTSSHQTTHVLPKPKLPQETLTEDVHPGLLAQSKD